MPPSTRIATPGGHLISHLDLNSVPHEESVATKAYRHIDVRDAVRFQFPRAETRTDHVPEIRARSESHSLRTPRMSQRVHIVVSLNSPCSSELLIEWLPELLQIASVCRTEEPKR